MSRFGMAVLGVAAVLVVGVGCTGRGPTPPSTSEEEWRRRGRTLEAADHPDSALITYREAARRYPTTSWPWAGVGRAAAQLGRFDEATNALKTALRWDAAARQERLQLAEITLADGHADEALALLDEAATIVPESGPSLALRARVLATAGRRGEARAVAARAMAQAPDDPECAAASAFCRAAEDSVEAALAELSAAQARHPEASILREERARVLEARGDVDGAIREYTRALSIEPRRPRARRRLVALLVGVGRLVEAEPHVRALLEDNPADVEALDALGTCALARGEPDVAEAAFRRAIEESPEFAAPYVSLGRFLATTGRREEAVAILRKARARTVGDLPRWAGCSVTLGEIYMDMGEVANALDVADAVLEREPGSLDARRLRGRALAAGGAGPASGDELARVLAGPDAVPSDACAWARWLLARKDVPRALGTLDSLLAKHPDDVEASALRAEALAASGKSAAAIRALEVIVAGNDAPVEARALLAHLRGQAALDRSDLEFARREFEQEKSLRPDRASAYLSLGEIEMQLGRPESARPLFERATELDPKSPRPWLHLGRVHEQIGDVTAALGAYRAALERDETSAEAHTRLARLLVEADVDLAQAETHGRRAVDLAPDDPAAQAALGGALQKNGRLDEAAAALRRAVELAPRDPHTRYALGVVQMQRGRRSEARSELQRALQLDPTFDHATEAKDLLTRLAD